MLCGRVRRNSEFGGNRLYNWSKVFFVHAVPCGEAGDGAGSVDEEVVERRLYLIPDEKACDAALGPLADGAAHEPDRWHQVPMDKCRYVLAFEDWFKVLTDVHREINHFKAKKMWQKVEATTVQGCKASVKSA